MKKSLLLSVVAMMGLSAFAEDQLIFSYDYNKLGEFTCLEAVQAGSNINAPAWTTVNGDTNWSNDAGMVVLSGNIAKLRSTILQGVSIVDMGGEVGKVLCINGTESKFNDYVKNNYGVELNAPNMGTVNPFWHINWFADPSLTPESASKDGATPTDKHIRVKFLLSVYDNTPGTRNCPLKVYGVDNQINVHPKSDDTAANAAVQTQEFNLLDEDGDDVLDDDENYMWDPSKWMSYEFDTWVPESEEGKSYSPIFAKFEFQNCWGDDGIKDKTVLIKSVEFYQVEGEPTSLNNHIHNMKTLKVFEYESGVGSLSVDNSNAPVEVFNLNGVRVNGENLPAGLYIRRQGTQASKFVVR